MPPLLLNTQSSFSSTISASESSFLQDPHRIDVFHRSSCYSGDTGHRGAEYPTSNIDELAHQGLILNQSYVLQVGTFHRTMMPITFLICPPALLANTVEPAELPLLL